MSDDSISAIGLVPAPSISMEEAASRKSEFLADRAKMDALLAGEVNATAEWRYIVNHIYQPAQVTEPRDQVVEDLNASAGYTLSDEVLQEYRENRPVTPTEYRGARARFDARKQDPEWIAKLNRGDPEVRRELALIQSILSRPVRDPQPQSQ